MGSGVGWDFGSPQIQGQGVPHPRSLGSPRVPLTPWCPHRSPDGDFVHPAADGAGGREGRVHLYGHGQPRDQGLQVSPKPPGRDWGQDWGWKLGLGSNGIPKFSHLGSVFPSQNSPWDWKLRLETGTGNWDWKLTLGLEIEVVIWDRGHPMSSTLALCPLHTPKLPGIGIGIGVKWDP